MAPWTRDTWQFIPTESEGRIANLVGGVLTLCCTAISVCALIAFYLVWRNKKLRYHLKRTSTRLLYACVAVTIPQGLGYASTCLRLAKHETAFCRLGMVLTVFGFNASNALQCCICFSLVLAIKKPSFFKHNLTWWYYVVSVIFSLFMAFLPIVFNQYQWSEANHSCWIKDSDSIFPAWELVIYEIPLVVVTIFMFISSSVVIRHLYTARQIEADHSVLINQLYEPTYATNADDLALEPDTNMNSRFEIEEVVVSEHFGTSYLAPTTPEKSKTRQTLHERISKGMRSPMWSPSVSLWSPTIPAHTPDQSPRTPVSDAEGRAAAVRAWIAPSTDLGIISEEPRPMKLRVARLPLSAHSGYDPVKQDGKKLRRAMIRVALFPLMHLIISLFGCLSSIVLSNGSSYSRSAQVAIYVTTFVGSAWVPLAYSVCALVADTSIWDAIQEAYNSKRHIEDDDLEAELGRNKHRQREQSSISKDGAQFVIHEAGPDTAVQHVSFDPFDGLDVDSDSMHSSLSEPSIVSRSASTPT